MTTCSTWKLWRRAWQLALRAARRARCRTRSPATTLVFSMRDLLVLSIHCPHSASEPVRRYPVTGPMRPRPSSRMRIQEQPTLYRRRRCSTSAKARRSSRPTSTPWRGSHRWRLSQAPSGPVQPSTGASTNVSLRGRLRRHRPTASGSATAWPCTAGMMPRTPRGCRRLLINKLKLPTPSLGWTIDNQHLTHIFVVVLSSAMAPTYHAFLLRLEGFLCRSYRCFQTSPQTRSRQEMRIDVVSTHRFSLSTSCPISPQLHPSHPSPNLSSKCQSVRSVEVSHRLSICYE